MFGATYADGPLPAGKAEATMTLVSLKFSDIASSLERIRRISYLGYSQPSFHRIVRSTSGDSILVVASSRFSEVDCEDEDVV